MNASPYLPRPPAPPHDPTSWRLGALSGWHRAKQVTPAQRRVIEPARSGTLTLARTPGTERRLTEPSGSFGGLRPPANVALGPDGSVYLLDTAALVLERFDPCACAFVTVPCFGGAGSGRRQLADPRALAIRGGRLFVCDR
ncbi:MAG: hypothetical protein HY216_17420, partial [Candidatus Rokubacteria bacterium]|nr:hypothetical protein [Candidatus Rokubacteria bacterium]